MEELMVRTFSVDGMTCEHCERAIQASVGAVDGVGRVEVDLEHKQVRVDGAASDDAIRAAIVDAGYEVADAPSDRGTTTTSCRRGNGHKTKREGGDA